VDTIINAVVTPLAQSPLTRLAMGIRVVQTLLTVPNRAARSARS
jgi:hypothetical protein